MAERTATRSADQEDGHRIVSRPGIMQTEIAALLAVDLDHPFVEPALGGELEDFQHPARADPDLFTATHQEDTVADHGRAVPVPCVGMGGSADQRSVPGS